MKKTAAIIAASVFALAASSACFAAEQGSMPMPMGHEGHKMQMSGIAHEEVVDGVKATFKVLDMRQHMKAMKMEMPKGMKDSHHLMVSFKDGKTGKALTEGEVKVKVIAPDKSEQVKNLMGMGKMAGMESGFGADFDFSKKGKYGVLTKFKLADGKVRSVKFWYESK